MPLTYVGDMPRRLIALSNCRPLKIDIADVKCGDILFVGGRGKKKLLSHVAIIIDADRIFHCSLSMGTAAVQTIDQFFSSYEQRLCFKEMIRYIDPRNTGLRDAHQGIFISD